MSRPQKGKYNFSTSSILNSQKNNFQFNKINYLLNYNNLQE